MFRSWSIRRSFFSGSGVPVRLGNTSGPEPLPSVRAASRISIARPHSGTRCARCAFMRVAGMVHTRSGRVDLRPLGPANLAPPRRRQHEQLESQPDDGSRAPEVPHGHNGRRHVAMRQRPHVLHGRPLRSEDRPDAVARVVGPQLHRHGPFQHRPDTLAHPPGGLRLLVPDGREDLQHVGAGHLRHQSPPIRGKA